MQKSPMTPSELMDADNTESVARRKDNPGADGAFSRLCMIRMPNEVTEAWVLGEIQRGTKGEDMAKAIGAYMAYQAFHIACGVELSRQEHIAVMALEGAVNLTFQMLHGELKVMMVRTFKDGRQEETTAAGLHEKREEARRSGENRAP